jgi:hypothetical protein
MLDQLGPALAILCMRLPRRLNSFISIGCKESFDVCE